MLKVIDISSHNGNIDFAKVKADGVGGVIIRVGFTGYGSHAPSIDSRFEEYYKGACAAGLPVGVYYFGAERSIDEVRAVKSAVNRWVAGKKMTLGVWYDMENNAPNIPASYPDKSANLWGQAPAVLVSYARELGWGIYASESPLNDSNILAQVKTLGLPLWVAKYSTNKPNVGRDIAAWQHTSNGAVSGVSGRVDMNEHYAYVQSERKTIEQLADEVQAGKWGNGMERKQRLAAAGYDPAAVQARVNEKYYAKKSVDDIAREVIAGKWGNGAERKQRLAAAGWDYAAVQRVVNRMLG